MSDRLNKAMQRGAQAEALANNELLNEILAKMDAEFVQAWRDSAAEAHDVRHNAYLMQRLLGDFRRRLTVIQRDGEAVAKATREGLVELD